MAHVGTILGMWAEVEFCLGRLLADFLGADARLGIAIFLALRAESAQREVLRVAAELKLPAEQARKLALFMGKLRDGSDERDKVAHGLWGFSQEYPDALLHQDPKASIHHQRLPPPGASLDQEDAARWEKDIPQVLIYRKADFEAIERRLAQRLNELFELTTEFRALRIARPPKAPA
jgi:hypothetical protein